MRKLCLILCFMLPISVFAEQVTMQNVRIWAAPDNTRVVFDVSGPVERYGGQAEFEYWHGALKRRTITSCQSKSGFVYPAI